ncbi:Transposase [Clostridiales bacterium CHKCI001]|nr:Transposase [Clostridiales bacterium CHKCI001]
MSRKSKIDAVEKVKIVEQYLNGELSQKGAAKICGVNKRCVQDWIRIYKAKRPTGLLTSKTNRSYSKELKLQAVHAYLSRQGSLDEICVKFRIRHHSQFMNWIGMYNEGKELKELTGGSAMKKARKTTLEERICIVKDCLEHDRNYGAMEGFWGILKREMYYGKRFTSKEELIQRIQNYIEYHNYRRMQRKLHIMTPMAFHELTLQAA